MSGKYGVFAALHVPGDPVMLYNIWDVASAHAVARRGQGAGHGQSSGGRSDGLADGERSRSTSLAHAANRRGGRIAGDGRFRGRLFDDPTRRRHAPCLAETGVVGCNFEDQEVGGRRSPPGGQQVAADRCDPPGSRRPNSLSTRAPTCSSMIARPTTTPCSLRPSSAAGLCRRRGQRLLRAPFGRAQVDRADRARARAPFNVIAFPGAPDKRRVG